MGHAGHINNLVPVYRFFLHISQVSFIARHETHLLQDPRVPLTPAFAVYATLWLGQ